MLSLPFEGQIGADIFFQDSAENFKRITVRLQHITATKYYLPRLDFSDYDNSLLNKCQHKTLTEDFLVAVAGKF